MAWSPDSKQIAFVSAVPGPETAEATGDPVVITPPQQRVAPQARADDGYIYPADGSSNEARYPAPGRRAYDTQAYQQQHQQQQQYYGNRGYAPAPQGYYNQPRQSYQPRGLFSYQD